MYTTMTTGTEPEGLLGGLFALGGFILVLAIIAILIGIAVVVLIIIANCKLFTKAGEKWWKAIVPVYNNWVLTRISGLAWYWFAILFVLGGLAANTYTSMAGLTEVYSTTITNSVWTMGICLVSFNYNYNIAKKFGKSNAFAFWMTVLPVIFLPILAFGKAQYNKSAEVDENGVFSIKK